MLPKYKDIVELLKKGSTLEAQEQIMSLREGALELQEENQELKAKICELEAKLQSSEDWENEKMRYSLVNPWQGPAQAYALIGEKSEGEQPHLLCTNCFHNAQKTILCPAVKGRDAIMNCPSCKSSINTGYARVGPAKFAEKYPQEG